MQFVPMSELLEKAAEGGYAVPSFCVWTAEMMKTVLRTAQEMRAPVILMNGPMEFTLMTPTELGAVAHGLAPLFQAEAALHLDHGNCLEQVEECLGAGYTSVMLDFSARPVEENIEGIRRVVAMARPRGVTVEGEIGVVGKVDDTTHEGGEEEGLTDPAQAAEYVARTGVDALAVAIGNAHGIYTRLPRLDFERLEQLRAATDVPLVLHGGSGTPEDDLRRAIRLGIAKVNIASELNVAVRDGLRGQWEAGENLWAPAAQAVAMAGVAEVVEKWIRLTGAEGKAQGKG
jgi:tagatose 1,6-diphosphate aldolase GatY/KbaY